MTDSTPDDLPAPLRAAYEATTYRAETPAGTLDLHVGAPSPALDGLLEELGAAPWAFITAANPASAPLDAPTNAARQAALARRLREAGYRFFPGAGVPAADSDWAPEPSFLVVGIDRAEAVALARAFGQNAIVAGERGQVAELVVC